jgi:hypothetical protein
MIDDDGNNDIWEQALNDDEDLSRLLEQFGLKARADTHSEIESMLESVLGKSGGSDIDIDDLDMDRVQEVGEKFDEVIGYIVDGIERGKSKLQIALELIAEFNMQDVVMALSFMEMERNDIAIGGNFVYDQDATDARSMKVHRLIREYQVALDALKYQMKALGEVMGFAVKFDFAARISVMADVRGEKGNE